MQQAEATPAATKHTSAAATPSSDQLTKTRAAHWIQDEKPLLTLEGLRNWINSCGLVAYGPRVAQMGAPAPSLLEATLGKRLDGGAELGESDAARSLLARLVAEGSAVPLNLLGVTGGVGTDVPDYVASASVFSYVFTVARQQGVEAGSGNGGRGEGFASGAGDVRDVVGEGDCCRPTTWRRSWARRSPKERCCGPLTELWAQLPGDSCGPDRRCGYAVGVDDSAVYQADQGRERMRASRRR